MNGVRETTKKKNSAR